MRVLGVITKVGKFWAVEVPLLAIHTQGKTRKEALEMVADAVSGIVGDEFKFQVHPFEDEGNIVIETEDTRALMSAILRQQRALSGKSIRDIAKALGSNSPRSYSAYEEGSRVPSLDKLAEILRAMNEDIEPVLTIQRKQGA